MHFQNIDFDIDIEIFGNFDIDIGIDIEKNGGNIENMSSENEASSSQTLSFLLDFLFFSLTFWDCFLSFRFFIIILGMICKKLIYLNQS